MLTCPVCFKIFAAKRYLTTHLLQSTHSCLLTLNGRSQSASTQEPFNNIPPQQSTIIQELPPSLPNNTDYHEKSIYQVNPFMDDSLAVNKLDDNSIHTTSSLNESLLHDPEDDDISDNIEPNNSSHIGNDITPITTIDAMESFNVPDVTADKLIIMVKLIRAVRQAGAPLNLVDKITHILKEEAHTGRFNTASLCSHRTALRKISTLYPLLPIPKMETISHERTAQELKNGTERPVLSFPTFSFLAQLQDLLDDHIFQTCRI